MKVREVLKAMEDMERPARGFLFACAAGAVALFVGAALVWTSIHVYTWASERFQVYRAAQSVRLWAVRMKQDQYGFWRIDAGPFETFAACERYTAILNRYSHYASIARQYRVRLRMEDSTPIPFASGSLYPPYEQPMPRSYSWARWTEDGDGIMAPAGDEKETIDACQAVRGAGREWDSVWPLGESLDDAQKKLSNLLAAMRRCWAVWNPPLSARPVDPRGSWIVVGNAQDIFCATPPKDWANLPTR